MINYEDVVMQLWLASYPKLAIKQQKLLNQEFIEIEIESFTDVCHEAIDSALSLCEEAVAILVPLIKERFSSFRNEVFQSTSWLDPQYWDKDHNTNGVDKFKWLITIFKILLIASNFYEIKWFIEWHQL